MSEAARLHCPIRGQLQTRQRARDGLTFSEEKRRIDAIRFLLQKGYPREHISLESVLLRFGNQGRNSFRADICVYDEPTASVMGLPLEERLSHIRLIGEIKRDNADAAGARQYQIKPALAFLPDLSALGLYWDDVERRFFYRKIQANRTQTHEASASLLPPWGGTVGNAQLTYRTLMPSKSLEGLFSNLEDALHPHIADKTRRYTVLLQLLIVKIHDENHHRQHPDTQLDLQDFSTSPLPDATVKARLNEVLRSAVSQYRRYLPEPISETFSAPAAALRRATELLAPVNLLESRKDVIQSFYMTFAQNLYKWDLAQYFTPYEVIDFIVNTLNPRYGEHVVDPACGSADFLISAFRLLKEQNSRDASQYIWGVDNSRQAVQISILNMLLNGDGKTNIAERDSLEHFDSEERATRFDVVLCNPPFGTKIVDRRFPVLQKFDMGKSWTPGDEGGGLEPSDEVLETQQTGILFAELCGSIVRSGGRVGIILPNGYLGNRSSVYHALRHWLLCHTRIVGVVGFPRFTFKKSGADVSASVVFFERRARPLASPDEDDDYQFYAGMIESVGWRVGDKRAEPLFAQDPETGEYILDTENERILDADFQRVMDEMLRSPVVDYFPWLLTGKEQPHGAQTSAIPIRQVLDDPDMILDAKRYCAKFLELRQSIEAIPHFRVGDVLEFVEEDPPRLSPSQFYDYVEIEKIDIGEYDFERLRGWQLPSRAKLVARQGDIFIPVIWGCAGKWFMAGPNAATVIVTNGCRRCRVRADATDLLLDLIAGLSSEAFRIQMRGLATGSDGLATVSDGDLLGVLLPRVQDEAARSELSQVLSSLHSGNTTVGRTVGAITSTIGGWPSPDHRARHWVLV